MPVMNICEWTCKVEPLLFTPCAWNANKTAWTEAAVGLSAAWPASVVGSQLIFMDLYEMLRDSSKGNASMPFVRFRKCLQAGSAGSAGTAGIDREVAAMMAALHTAGFGVSSCAVLNVDVCSMRCLTACM